MDELEAMLRSETRQYQQVMSMILEYQQDFPNIPVFPNAANPLQPCRCSDMLPWPDAAVLYAFIAKMQPSHYVEIGSGHSTKIAAEAVARHSRHTEIVSIDTNPPNEVAALCDRVIQERLQDVPIEVFTALVEGDIVFLNGSHVSHMHSDVTRFFLDILPRLRRGVLVQVHDVFLPDDYPPELGIDRGYNEQYLLAAYLLGGAKHVRILFPCHYLLKCDWSQTLWQAWDRMKQHCSRQTPGCEPWGGSFWLQIS